jgi:hypothetical protein
MKLAPGIMLFTEHTSPGIHNPELLKWWNRRDGLGSVRRGEQLAVLHGHSFDGCFGLQKR